MTRAALLHAVSAGSISVKRHNCATESRTRLRRRNRPSPWTEATSGVRVSMPRKTGPATPPLAGPAEYEGRAKALHDWHQAVSEAIRVLADTLGGA